MKSNPYVYPFIPFKDLGNKKIQENFIEDQKINKRALKEILQRIKFPDPKIEGESTGEKILALFLDDNYRFGPQEFIKENSQSWIDRFNYFILKGLPLQFTILGFPFKMPVPLKTKRTLPDMGEVLALFRLQKLMEKITGIYLKGARVTVFTEGGFGTFTGVPRENWVAYREELEKLIQELDFKNIMIHDLSQMEGSVADFSERFQKRVQEYRSLYEKRDPHFIKKYEGTWDSVQRIVDVKNYSLEEIMDAYNGELKEEELSPSILKAREDIKKRTHESIFQYHAYLKVRDDIGYLEKIVPHGLPLSVSPKPDRLGIIPVNEKCSRLPYHGVVIYNEKEDTYQIEYLVDILRDGNNYQRVFLLGDKDKEPFYFIKK